MKNEIYKDEGYRLMGAAFEVYNDRGYGLGEEIYSDLSVFNYLVVELKAVSQLVPEHEAQLNNYMRLTRQPVGYLINFGHKDTLEWKRIILSEFISPND